MAFMFVALGASARDGHAESTPRSASSRKVIVHRPGLEQRRLTPDNAEDLLFDDVIWVRKAKVEHDAFVQAMRERGVEVFDAEDLLAEVLGVPDGQGVGARPGARRAPGRPVPRPQRARVGRRGERDGGRRLPDRRDDQGRRRRGRRPVLRLDRAADMLLPPLPNFLFQRDPSSWIYDGVTHQPDDEAGAATGDGDHGGDLPLPSDVRGRRRRQRLARRGRAGLGATARSRAATSRRSATAR